MRADGPRSPPLPRLRDPVTGTNGVPTGPRALMQPQSGPFASRSQPTPAPSGPPTGPRAARPIEPPSGAFASRPRAPTIEPPRGMNPERAAALRRAAQDEEEPGQEQEAPRVPGKPSSVFVRNRRPQHLGPPPSLTPDIDREVRAELKTVSRMQIAALRSHRLGALVGEDLAAASAARRQAEETRVLDMEARSAAAATQAAQAHLDALNRSIAAAS